MHDRQLYIVGNGFDLWHGIPSSFKQFKAFVREHDRALLQLVEDHLPTDENWNHLEHALARIDVDSIIGELGHFMPSYGADDWSDSGHHDFQYEVSRLVQSLSEGLKRQLTAWMRQLSPRALASGVQRLQTLNPAASFLTFNYTPTLQQLYDVPNSHILHIHGRADDPDSALILGHAWNPKERCSLNDRPDIEDIDTRLMEANAILDSYFSTTFKPSKHLIQNHHLFFQQQADIGTVCVLGRAPPPASE